jgi:hypothetical protein
MPISNAEELFILKEREGRKEGNGQSRIAQYDPA